MDENVSKSMLFGLLDQSRQVVVVAAHLNHLCGEAVSVSSFCQGLEVDVEPGECIAFDGFVLHLVL